MNLSKTQTFQVAQERGSSRSDQRGKSLSTRHIKLDFIIKCPLHRLPTNLKTTSMVIITSKTHKTIASKTFKLEARSSRKYLRPSLDCSTVAQQLDVLPCWIWLRGPFAPQGTPANSSLAAAACAGCTSAARFPQGLGMQPGASKSPQCPCLAF